MLHDLVLRKYTNPHQRNQAASEVLERVANGGVIGQESVAARLFALALTCDPEPQHRWLGLEILGYVGNSQSRFRVRECCLDNNEYVRATAVSALASVGNKRDYALMRRMRNDPSLMVRRYASVALYDLAGDSVLEELIDFAEREEDVESKWGVYQILADKGDSEAKVWLRVHRV